MSSDPMVRAIEKISNDFSAQLPVLMQLHEYPWTISKIYPEGVAAYVNTHGRVLGIVDLTAYPAEIPKGTARVVLRGR